jgi:predicted glycoside hydrolase/deacetylase ChbG (UPF0249 family)
MRKLGEAVQDALACEMVIRCNGVLMGAQRRLIVIADDFGMGPNTSAGILHLALRGIVTGSVLLVNSPYADEGVRLWRQLGCPMELGWHPNLTLDQPIRPAKQVASLVDRDGVFWPLGTFLQRWLTGQLVPDEIEAELQAQADRFRDMVGHPPTVINTHQHVGLFPPVGDQLLKVLSRQANRPYVRRVREPMRMLWRIRGARLKRVVLSVLGKKLSEKQEAEGFPGNDTFAGLTDPKWVRDPQFFTNWLAQVPGRVVELMCHPGHPDPTLVGRDCEEGDGLLQRRVDELRLLEHSDFQSAVREAGFTLSPPSQLHSQRACFVRAA